MIKLIVIAGPTASGKSSFAINIAKKYNGEIISCDSMQIYKYFDIGTAKITYNAMDGIKHHMLDIVQPKAEFTVGEFSKMAKSIIIEIAKQKKIPILCGGTGLYIESILYSYSFGGVSSDVSLRMNLENELAKNGPDFMYKKLLEIDPIDAKNIHPNNTRRVIRALELYYLSGKQKSSLKEKELLYDVFFCNLDPPINELYNNINSRVDNMFDLGLENEVKSLLNSGVSFKDRSMQAIGYKEFEEYFEGKISIVKLKERIKQNSRHYAKRQRTWMKRYHFAKSYNSYDKKELELAEKNISLFLNSEMKGKI